MLRFMKSIENSESIKPLRSTLDEFEALKNLNLQAEATYTEYIQKFIVYFKVPELIKNVAIRIEYIELLDNVKHLATFDEDRFFEVYNDLITSQSYDKITPFLI